MATSLAKQLKRLAIPGQPSLKQATSKKQPSLLYSPEKAATLSVDEIYALGCNGLSELITTDPSFSRYEDTLFQESCKAFERSTQAREVLEEVDERVAEFLRHLSPYFLQRPAQKCLEWLIRAFRINSCNVDALMECVLPYYETNLFARVVQLLPLKSHAPSRWHWLRPVRKSGTPLSKQTLVQHCMSELPFLVFVCEMVPSSIRAHQHSNNFNGCMKVTSLYVSTVMAVLERVSPVTEELVSRLVPFLEVGLKSGSADYVAGSYMVLSQLSCVANMEAKLAETLVVQVCKVMLLSLGI